MRWLIRQWRFRRLYTGGIDAQQEGDFAAALGGVSRSVQTKARVANRCKSIHLGVGIFWLYQQLSKLSSQAIRSYIFLTFLLVPHCVLRPHTADWKSRPDQDFITRTEQKRVGFRVWSIWCMQLAECCQEPLAFSQLCCSSFCLINFPVNTVKHHSGWFCLSQQYLECIWDKICVGRLCMLTMVSTKMDLNLEAIALAGRQICQAVSYIWWIWKGSVLIKKATQSWASSQCASSFKCIGPDCNLRVKSCILHSQGE